MMHCLRLLMLFLAGDVATSFFREDMESVPEEPRGLLRKHVRNEETLCGNYLLPVKLIQTLVGKSPPEFPWFESVRLEVLDCMRPCQHGCFHVIYNLNWWFPKGRPSQEQEVDVQQYARVSAFMLQEGQEQRVLLCNLCQNVGPLLDIPRISLGMTHQLTQAAEMYDRWFTLNIVYDVSVPLRPKSKNDYTAVYTDSEGVKYVFAPRANTVPRETHIANQTSHSQRETRKKALPPNEYHALFWIFAFLLELLDEVYENADDIPDKYRKKWKVWVNAHAMKIQPGENGQPHPVRATLSSFCHRIVDLRGFVTVMQEHLQRQITPANEHDVLGFRGLKSRHIQLEPLVVRLANMTAALLPQTIFFQIHANPSV